jgi:hypothetical protein
MITTYLPTNQPINQLPTLQLSQTQKGAKRGRKGQKGAKRGKKEQKGAKNTSLIIDSRLKAKPTLFNT